MAEKSENQRKRPSRPRSKKGHAHHSGAWKVAYADFVTAMMALFMVLWILSQGPEMKQAVAAYFTDPRGLPISQVNRSLMDNIGIGLMDHMPVVNSIGSGDGSGDQFAKAMTVVAQDSEKLQKAGEKIMQQIVSKQQLSGLADMITVEKSDNGLRVELQDKVEGTFFDLGSAHPKDSLRAALTEIAEVLKPLENKVAIEGHTDARPYQNGGQGYSNWELSADRANAVRRLMSDLGYPPDHISDVRAFADRVPLDGIDPIDGRNRRISIFVQALNVVMPADTAEENKPEDETAPLFQTKSASNTAEEN